MNKENVIAIVIATIAIFLALVGLVGGNDTNSEPTLAGVTNYDALEATSLAIGTGCNDSMATCSGTTLTKALNGTMNCTGAATVGAASTADYDCSVTGVSSGDKVFVSLPTPVANIYVAAAYASTTASNSIRLVLGNASSTAAVAPVDATSSVPYLVLD